MLKAIFCTLRFIILILAGHKDIALENAALRQQLTILKREQPRPKLRHRDRLFWISSDEDLETMENGARRRTTRYGCELAAAAIQAVLEEAVPEEGTRTSEGLCRRPEPGSNDGRG
jgi:hypothetical protein